MRNSQQAAATAVRLVLSGQNLNSALDSAGRKSSLSGQERSSMTAFSYGTLRHLGFLRFALDQLVSRPPKDEGLSSLLLVALYQLQFGNAPDHAVVNHAVDSVNSSFGKRQSSFANAVLRGFLRKREKIIAAAKTDDVAELSYPRWWIDKLRTELGSHADDILRTGNLHPPMTLRVNTRLIKPADYLTLLANNDIGGSIVQPGAIRLESPLPVNKLPGFSEGMASVQDAGAQLSAPMLDLKSGQTVVDACAAPGGKTGHILELADVELTALDKDAQRLDRVDENLRRLGLSARTQCADAANLEAWWDGKPVDRVLLDAPCTASGVVRRHPDIKWLRRERDIGGFAQQQKRLLDAMWKVVQGSGKLLYVTCSLFREENQSQVKEFLARHTDARLLAGAADVYGELLFPAENRDGFFHALFQKA